MKAFIQWLRWKVAGREMRLLHRYETAAWAIDDWLDEYLDSAPAAGRLRGWVENDDDHHHGLSQAIEGMRARLHHDQSEWRRDTDLLDFLERHAVVSYSYEQSSITIDVPDDFDGADSIRAIIEAAKAREDVC
jgi:hypothetical protein